MVSSAPYRGYRPVYWVSVTSPEDMTQPWYWLAPNTIEGENIEKNREKNKRYNCHEHQEISILTFKKARTRLKLLLEKFPDKDLQNWEERTTQKGQN
jgi:hypothetical protein